MRKGNSLAFLLAFCVASPLLAENAAPGTASNETAKPAAAPTAAGEAAAPSATKSLKVEIKIGKGVADREATGVADSFTSDTEQLVGWTRIEGANEPVEVKHVWSLNGKEVASIPLEVKSSSFRTWTRKAVSGMTGTWNLSVKDADGHVLASKDVQVTAAAAPAPAAPVTK